jgi:hypothetical protein
MHSSPDLQPLSHQQSAMWVVVEKKGIVNKNTNNNNNNNNRMFASSDASKLVSRLC